jgi:hypothetical protein
MNNILRQGRGISDPGLLRPRRCERTGSPIQLRPERFVARPATMPSASAVMMTGD